MGHAPTRRHISLEAVDIGRIADGQAHERRGGLNMYAVLTQLDGTRHSCHYHHLPGMLP